MEKQPSSSAHRHSKLPRRIFIALLSVILVLSVLAPVAYAAWDGQGETSDKVTDTVSGDFYFNSADVEAVTGYRFSVYDEQGKKVGDSVDIVA